MRRKVLNTVEVRVKHDRDLPLAHRWFRIRSMPVATKRWNDPVSPGDGFRLLVCRIRPRGLARADETWDAWWPDLGPSRRLLDDFHGKSGPPIRWDDYVPRYLEEMRGPGQLWRIRDLARRAAAGETVTLLCSSACTDPDRCHRTLLARLVERAAGDR